MHTQALMNNYGVRQLTLVKGEGCTLWDDQGNTYLDALAGIAVCGLGHCHPAITEAVSHQLQTLVHTSNLYNLPVQQKAAEGLCEASGMDKVFFCNSGTEANEAAIKLARKYGHEHGISHPVIITTHGSFHGRTMGGLSATGNTKAHENFTPLLEGFIHVPYNDVDAIKALSDQTNIVAILVEPVQGEGGIQTPDNTYLTQLRSLCDQNNWLLMLDEIQTGNARTGHYFAHQAYDFKPDVLTTAKGLGNGIPVGACLSQGSTNDIFQAGNHGSTYGGNPIACAAVSAVNRIIKEDDMLNQVDTLANYFAEGFNTSLANKNTVKEIRQRGLMIGIELDHPCADLVQRAADKSVLLNVTASSVIRLLPPFIMTQSQADQVIETVSSLID